MLEFLLFLSFTITRFGGSIGYLFFPSEGMGRHRSQTFPQTGRREIETSMCRRGKFVTLGRPGMVGVELFLLWAAQRERPPPWEGWSGERSCCY